MEKIKLIDVVNLSKAFKPIVDQKLKPSFAYKMLKVIEKINSELNAIEQIKQTMLKDNDEDEEKTLGKYLNFLNTTDSIAEFQSFTLQELEDNGVLLSPSELSIIGCVIEEEE